MSSEKVFILGLDGASPEVIESLIALGKLPTFEKMKREGIMGKLRTTIPPITAAAWRMPGGTVSSISASSEGAPTASSIAAISAGDGPMCRRVAES